MHDILFIGGPYDGRRIPIDPRLNDVVVPAAVSGGLYENVHYRRERFTPGVSEIFVLGGMPLEAVIGALIDRYGKIA
ncbi:MAG TPA: hypothetical protein VGH74_07630 [Planctomycetaceae bacterium]|jgi:hypothetical protein